MPDIVLITIKCLHIGHSVGFYWMVLYISNGRRSRCNPETMVTPRGRTLLSNVHNELKTEMRKVGSGGRGWGGEENEVRKD